MASSVMIRYTNKNGLLKELLSSNKVVQELRRIILVRHAATTKKSTPDSMLNQGSKGKTKSKLSSGKRPVAIRKSVFMRSQDLDPDKIDWSDVMTVAESYNPSLVPIPIRMGRIRHKKTTDPQPFAVNNIELLKIPNFLHLTPPAIEKHCKALKPLCKPWPEHFAHRPLRFTTYNFIYPGPSIRHPDSRRIKLQVYLKDLQLDDHARRKMIILAGTRYNPANDELTLIEDRCPTRKQNKDYAMYLLTTLYHESLKTESWEEESADEIKMKSDAELRHLTENVLGEKPVQERKRTQWKRVIGNHLVRFNRYGKAFVVENRKHGIFGPVDKSIKKEIEREWELIKGQND